MTEEKLKHMVSRWTWRDLCEALAGNFGHFFPHEMAIIKAEHTRRMWGWADEC